MRRSEGVGERQWSGGVMEYWDRAVMALVAKLRFNIAREGRGPARPQFSNAGTHRRLVGDEQELVPDVRKSSGDLILPAILHLLERGGRCSTDRQAALSWRLPALLAGDRFRCRQSIRICRVSYKPRTRDCR